MMGSAGPQPQRVCFDGQTPCEVDLEQMLSAREKRAKRQRTLLERYQNNLICFTVNMPGPRKRTPASRKIFDAGWQSIIGMLNEKNARILHKASQDLVTGPEGYVVVILNDRILKKYLIEIESRHPLGRLFDLDVIRLDGTPVSRTQLGEPARKCLLCDGVAHVCSRNRRHCVPDLTRKINETVRTYLNRDDLLKDGLCRQTMASVKL